MSRLTLSILNNATPTPAIVSLVIFPNKGSTRSPINWIKESGKTAVGSTVVSGVTAISRVFIWDIQATLKEWELLRLERIIWLQQNRFISSPSTARISLEDRFARVNEYEYNLNGRTAVSGSAQTSNGETSYFSNFNVIAEIAEKSQEKLNPWVGDTGLLNISLILREIV
jgi:hypothetical protein